MKTNLSLIILVMLLGLLSVGALFGGGALMISPNGNLLQMPISFLDSSPFKNFFMPGLILFSILGLFPIIVILGLIKKPTCKICEMVNLLKDMHWAWSFCIYISFGLIIWIQAQMIFLKTVFWLQTFYMTYALILLIILLLPPTRRSFNKENITRVQI